MLIELTMTCILLLVPFTSCLNSIAGQFHFSFLVFAYLFAVCNLVDGCRSAFIGNLAMPPVGDHLAPTEQVRNRGSWASGQIIALNHDACTDTFSFPNKCSVYCIIDGRLL